MILNIFQVLVKKKYKKFNLEEYGIRKLAINFSLQKIKKEKKIALII